MPVTGPLNGNDTTSSDPHIWMIRTSDNVLSGPYTQEQLIQLVEEEKLELTDEICRGNSYWIYLHEEQEVKKHLGIEVPAALVEPEEPTQTETDSIIARRNEPSHHHHATGSTQATAAAAMGARAQRNATISPDQSKTEYTPVVDPIVENEGENDDVPELAVSADSIEDHTAVLNNRAFREFRPREQQSTQTTTAAPSASQNPSATTSTSLTDVLPQAVNTTSNVNISPAVAQVEGVSVNHGEPEEMKRLWIYVGAAVVVGLVAVFMLWRHFFA